MRLRAARAGALCCLATVISCMVAQSPVAAQATVRVGLGPAVPTADFGDRADLGWSVLGGLDLRPLAGSWVFGIETRWSRHAHQRAPDGDRTDLYAILPRIAYRFDLGGDLDPHLGAVGGVMWRRFASRSQPGLEASRSGAGTGAFAGASYPVGRVPLFVEGWWIAGWGDLEGTHVLGLTVGVQFAVGGGM